MKTIQTWACLAALALAGQAHAVPFTGTYTFTGSPGNQASEPVDVQPAGAVLSDITRGSGLTAAAAGDSMSSSGFSTAGIDLNDYYQFVITPGIGADVDLTNLLFSERRSGTGIASIEVRSSLDSFAAAIATFAVPDDTLTRRQTVTFGAPFQNLTSALTLRIYGYAAEASGGTWRLGVSGGGDNPSGFPSDLVINGDITITAAAIIPEPATVLLGVAAIAGFAARRRR